MILPGLVRRAGPLHVGISQGFVIAGTSMLHVAVSQQAKTPLSLLMAQGNNFKDYAGLAAQLGARGLHVEVADVKRLDWCVRRFLWWRCCCCCSNSSWIAAGAAHTLLAHH